MAFSLEKDFSLSCFSEPKSLALSKSNSFNAATQDA